jgi:hypothetical protein
MSFDDYPPGAKAPSAGRYEELNVFGTRTGKTFMATQGAELPPAPRGFTWRALGRRSTSQLRDRAEEFRCMATAASTIDFGTTFFIWQRSSMG